MMRLCRPYGAHGMIGDSFQGLTPLATNLRPAGAGCMMDHLFQGLTPLATNLRPSGARRAMSDCRPVIATGDCDRRLAIGTGTADVT